MSSIALWPQTIMATLRFIIFLPNLCKCYFKQQPYFRGSIKHTLLPQNYHLLLCYVYATIIIMHYKWTICRYLFTLLLLVVNSVLRIEYCLSIKIYVWIYFIHCVQVTYDFHKGKVHKYFCHYVSLLTFEPLLLTAFVWWTLICWPGSFPNFFISS